MRPTCVHCGKKYGRRVTHEVAMKWNEGEAEPYYQGNLVEVRTRITKGRPATALPTIGGRAVMDLPAQPNKKTVEVWNGKSWIGGYEPFCTLRCALAYARRAYNKTKGAL